MPTLMLAAAMLANDGAPPPAYSFGVDLRQQAEFTSANVLDPASSSDAVLLHRLQANADMRPIPALRAYMELGVYTQNGRDGGPSPVDESDLDLHEGFIELRLPDSAWRLRLGRQEWSLGSGRLVSVRDGPNIRRAFDAVEAEIPFAQARVFVLWGRPVINRSGAFDDRANSGESLGGVHASMPLTSVNVGLDAYVLRYQRDVAAYARELRDEARTSWGMRLHGMRGHIDFNTEAVWQNGRIDGGSIRAWTLAHDGGWTFETTRYAPRLGLKLDIASGDGTPDDDRLETFNAMYPNPSYFSDAALVAPANLIDIQPNLQLTLSPQLSAYAGWNLLWKHRKADAIYLTPVPLTPVPGSTGSSRFIGQQAQLSLQWHVNEHLDLEASVVHFEAGRGLREAGGQDQDFLQLVINLSY